MAEIAPATRFGQPSVSLARAEAGGAGALGFADLLQALLGSTAMPAPAQPSPTDNARATSGHPALPTPGRQTAGREPDGTMDRAAPQGTDPDLISLAMPAGLAQAVPGPVETAAGQSDGLTAGGAGAGPIRQQQPLEPGPDPTANAARPEMAPSDDGSTSAIAAGKPSAGARDDAPVAAAIEADPGSREEAEAVATLRPGNGPPRPAPTSSPTAVPEHAPSAEDDAQQALGPGDMPVRAARPTDHRLGPAPAAAGPSAGSPQTTGATVPAGSADKDGSASGQSADDGPSAGGRHAEGAEKDKAQASPAPTARRGEPPAPADQLDQAAKPPGAQTAPPAAGASAAGHTMPASASAAADVRTAVATSPAPVATQIAVAVAGAAQQRTTRLTVALSPQELGGVEITLEFGRDRQLKAAIRVDKADTLQLIRHDAASVVHSLESAGFDLGSTGLQLELRDQGGGQRQPEIPGTDIAAATGPASGVGTSLPAGPAPGLPGTLDMTV